MIEKKKHMRVLEIALNESQNGNALNISLCNELLEGFDSAESDVSVGSILLTAQGPDFCSGMDLVEQLEADKIQLGGIHQRLYSVVQYMHKPIVAAVRGNVFAGGVGLVANAHVVVAHPESSFKLPELEIGYWPVFIFRAVEHAIGERRAMELSLTGRDFGAAEALRLGLVTEISSDPVNRAAEIAARISTCSPTAIREGLSYAHQIRGRDWEHAGQVGDKVRRHLLASEDYREGVSAAIEKRQPQWPSLVHSGA